MDENQIIHVLHKIVGNDFVSNRPEELFIYSQDTLKKYLRIFEVFLILMEL